MAKPRVFATVGLAYSDTLRAARAMPVLMIAAVIVSAANAWVEWIFGLWQSETVLTGKVLLFRLVVGVAYIILLAPARIAIFRFIVLDAFTRGYPLDANSQRFQLFCGWSIALFMLSLALDLVTRIPGIEGDTHTTLDWSLSIAVLAIGVLLALLFPAIAVDASGATLRNAVADLRGSFWRAVGILLLTALPIIAVFLICMIAIYEIAKIENASAVLWLVTLSWELVWTAAAARLYLALANRLRSPES